MSKRFEDGARVRVTIEGVVEPDSTDDCMTIHTGDDSFVYMEIKGAAHTVERLAPAGWPGEPGTVWRRAHDYALFFVVEHEGSKMLAGTNGGVTTLDIVLSLDNELTCMYDPSAPDAEPEPDPAEPLHTWPPTEPGQWYRGSADHSRWESVEFQGEICLRHFYSPNVSGSHIQIAAADVKFGPMIPIPTPGGAS